MGRLEGSDVWALFPGARGASDGSAGAAANVPAALSVLRHAALYHHLPGEVEEAFDVLENHALANDRLYPVAVTIVPYLFDIVRDSAPKGGRLPEIVARYLALAGTLDAPMRDRLRGLVDERASEVATWVGRYDRAVAALAVYSAKVKAAVLAKVAAATAVAPEMLLALIDLGEAPGMTVRLALEMLDDAERPRLARMSAAAFLVRYGDGAPDLRVKLDALLSPSAPAALARFVDELWRPTVARPNMAPRMCDAEVVFAGERLVLVRAGERSVTLPWADAPVQRGDTFKVGLSTHGEPRVALLTAEDGSVTVVDF